MKKKNMARGGGAVYDIKRAHTFIRNFTTFDVYRKTLLRFFVSGHVKTGGRSDRQNDGRVVSVETSH